MRLLQNVLHSLKKTKKPQYKFVTHLLGLMLMLPGHATFRNMSRYSPYHERTFSRWYARDFDWVSLNQAAITEAVPPEHDQALVMDASFVPKSGKHTYGLDRFWNGSHSRVVYLQPAGNAVASTSGKIPPFHYLCEGVLPWYHTSFSTS